MASLLRRARLRLLRQPRQSSKIDAAETRNGIAGTTVRDHVTYQMPFGPLGEVAQRIAGKAQFSAIFNYRHQRTAELLAIADAQM